MVLSPARYSSGRYVVNQQDRLRLKGASLLNHDKRPHPYKDAPPTSSHAALEDDAPVQTTWLSPNATLLTPKNLATPPVSSYLVLKPGVLTQGATYLLSASPLRASRAAKVRHTASPPKPRCTHKAKARNQQTRVRAGCDRGEPPASGGVDRCVTQERAGATGRLSPVCARLRG